MPTGILYAYESWRKHVTMALQRMGWKTLSCWENHRIYHFWHSSRPRIRTITPRWSLIGCWILKNHSKISILSPSQMKYRSTQLMKQWLQKITKQHPTMRRTAVLRWKDRILVFSLKKVMETDTDRMYCSKGLHRDFNIPALCHRFYTERMKFLVSTFKEDVIRIHTLKTSRPQLITPKIIPISNTQG